MNAIQSFLASAIEISFSPIVSTPSASGAANNKFTSTVSPSAK